MSPIASYRHLFGLTGRTYIVVAFLARLPLAMSQMGVLLLIAHSTGSFGAGGACAGALAIANAVGAPLLGATSDRLGQHRVVLMQSWASAIALLAVVGAAESGVAWAWAAVAAAVAGFFIPQAGPLARVRWRPIITTRGRPGAAGRLIDTAFSYEGSADEASFVLGPALVGTIASLVNPGVGICTAAVLLAVFGTLFAIHPTARLRAARDGAAGGGRLLTPALATLMAAQLIIGTIFGSIQTGATVVATDAGHEGLAGLVQAVLGVGSVVAGLSMAALPARIGYVTRWRATATGLLVLTTPLLLVHTLLPLCAVLLVLGCCVAPYMITTFTLGEQLTSPARTGAAMTLLAAATGLGYAVGAAVAGHFADLSGVTAAFTVTLAAAVAACALAAVAGRLLGRTLAEATEPEANHTSADRAA